MRAIVAATFVLISAAFASDEQGPTIVDNGLRGHVKQCVEQTVYPSGEFPSQLKTYTYSPEGSLLELRSDYGVYTLLETYTYRSGRLIKKAYSNETSQSNDTPRSEQAYSYDFSGRLLSISSDPRSSQLTYEYDSHGQKRRVQHLPVIESRPDVAYAAVAWEGSDLQLVPVSSGTFTTLYDEHDRPIEARVQDANGKLTQRIIREYDDKGHILSDRLSSESGGWDLPSEMTSALNNAQTQAIAKFMQRAFGAGKSTFKYDAQGHLTEKNVTNGAFGNQVTTFKYDEHGNVIDEETISTPSSDWGTEYGMDENGKMVPIAARDGIKPSHSNVHYAYEYDAQDNWIRKTVSRRTEMHGEFKVSMTIYRTLTYH